MVERVYNVMYCFIITSTINTSSGEIPINDRFSQTLETISSIRKKVNNSYIILIENSPLDSSLEQTLSVSVDFYLNISNRSFVKYINKVFNVYGQKGVGEAYMIQVGLDHAKSLDCERIFKISGRYKLSDTFNISEYQRYSGYVFRIYDGDGYNDLVTRLWSLSPNLIDNCINSLESTIVSIFNDKLTLEQAMYKSFTENIEFVDILHVEGYLAPQNILVKD